MLMLRAHAYISECLWCLKVIMMASYELASGEVCASSVLPSDMIGLSDVLESPQSPIEDDHGMDDVETDLSSDEEFVITKHEVLPSETKLQHGRNSVEGNVGMPTPGEEPDCRIRSSKRPRLVPKQYQIDEEVVMRSSRLPEVKEFNRSERRHQTPRSPSPHGHRRYHHSPSSQYGEKRRYQRDRPSSPGICTPRPLSHSPPGYAVSPPHRHYSTSPPFPRYGTN